jgi:hypothetical protein
LSRRDGSRRRSVVEKLRIAEKLEIVEKLGIMVAHLMGVAARGGVGMTTTR